MKDINQKIINAIMKKAESVCPGALDLLGVYGSAATGDEHEKSDLDLMILINDDAGRQLSETFILEDIDIAYDLYCTSWEMLEGDAGCEQAHLSKLFDSKVIYYRDESVLERLDILKKQAKHTLSSESRYEKAQKSIAMAEQEYAQTYFTENISKVRTHAAEVIYYMLDSLMLYHGRYYKLGTKRTFQELQDLDLPFPVQKLTEDIIRARTTEEIRKKLTVFIVSLKDYMEPPKKREEPSQDNIAGTYEEMFSNWKNKMYEAAERGDLFSSFMNLEALQLMIHDIAEGVKIKDLEIMDQFDPENLEKNIAVFEAAMSAYSREYDKLGMKVRRYSNVDDFIAAYLTTP